MAYKMPTINFWGLFHNQLSWGTRKESTCLGRFVESCDTKTSHPKGGAKNVVLNTKELVFMGNTKEVAT